MADARDDPALLLRDFVNTLNVEEGADELATPAALAGWLAGRRLAPAGATATDLDLATAITLREGLRAAWTAHHAPRPADLPADLPDDLEDALAALPLRLTLSGGSPGLVPLDPPATSAAALARLTAAIMDTVAAGTWPRLKVCQEDTCRWAFLDTSKNRSRAWCSMRVCGNRTKTRAYRARRRA
ncbi:putative RNA-binding Zn ribbon-like protein [Actinomadura pelletieri DSM 43383]|uniref:Putative RNA-binding Zn ribbon-like protein n=1 Tax=Actinomadura pelletieri DSM 43383 TaxID=1120940 RepID=A0A495QPM0_9ACTN|nr:CGNR zinc finger domain-containing protein [Actinomadura pelletieri]RKS74908.1 putative RNA-binding Zn ribbon-like protein [Actinomadura pelletieri DSM 43383]